MLRFILDLVTAVRVYVMRRTNLALETLALRQQVVVLKRKQPRSKLNQMDRLTAEIQELIRRMARENPSWGRTQDPR